MEGFLEAERDILAFTTSLHHRKKRGLLLEKSKYNYTKASVSRRQNRGNRRVLIKIGELFRNYKTAMSLAESYLVQQHLVPNGKRKTFTLVDSSWMKKRPDFLSHKSKRDIHVQWKLHGFQMYIFNEATAPNSISFISKNNKGVMIFTILFSISDSLSNPTKNLAFNFELIF